MKNGPGKTGLMDQQSAVLSYLEDLLKEVPEGDSVPDNVVEVFPKERQARKPEQEKTRPVQADITVVPENNVKPAVNAKRQEQQTDKEAGTEKNKTDINIPEWAKQEFQCLLFHVAGITLAVPLVKLNGVIPWSNDLTPMPGHSAAFLGLLRHLNKNVKVMDTALVIMPEAQRATLGDANERAEKILLIDEGRWGLACDKIGEVINLEKKDVRWRTSKGKRAWLAGTISERLCALLDTDVMTDILVNGK